MFVNKILTYSMYRFGEKIPELIELSLIYILSHFLMKTQVI